MRKPFTFLQAIVQEAAESDRMREEEALSQEVEKAEKKRQDVIILPLN